MSRPGRALLHGLDRDAGGGQRAEDHHDDDPANYILRSLRRAADLVLELGVAALLTAT